MSLSGDLSSMQRAISSEYKFSSTGEAVVDTDFLATWNLVEGE